ncbi:MAG: zf-HC2 domain-containing protein [Bacillota bacterium]
MCYSEGSLQAFLDGETSRRQAARIGRHLAGCPACCARLQTLRENEAWVTGCLDRYAGTAAEKDAQEAWQKFRSSRYKPSLFQEKGVSALRNKKFWAALATAAALVFAFSFGPVRSLAGEFLQVLRVERFKVIKITERDMAQLERVLARGGHIDLESLGEVTVSSEINVRPVTLAEARQALDFPVRMPSRLPAGFANPELHLSTPQEVSFTPKVENVNALLRSLGGRHLLPAGLEGKTFTFKIPPVLAAYYRGAGPAAGKLLVVVQARSPELIVPPGVDVAAVRDALLNIPGLPENLRRQLAAIGDWQHTLPLPAEGPTTEVTVDGRPGIFVFPPHAGGNSPSSNLIWQRDGVLYYVQGPLSLREALDLAASLR